MVNVPGLTNVNTWALQHVASSFSNASSWFRQADQEFTAQVTRPLTSGHAWSGTGQPAALSVVRTNNTAMTIGDLRMRTANNVVLALYHALTAAQAAMRAAVREAEQQGFVVNDDGTVDHLPDPERPDKAGLASIAEGKILGALLHARLADDQASTVMSRVGRSMPMAADVACPTSLSHNDGLFTAAADDFEISRQALEFWESARVEPLPEEAHEPLVAFLKEHGDTILDIAGFIPGIGVAARALRLTKLVNLGRRATEDAPRPRYEPPREGEWRLPERGGAWIGGRWYSEHALERMAPNTPRVRAVLEQRARERAQREGLEPGTRAYAEWWRHHGPDPRGIPPSVVKAEVENPGSTNVRVITNSKGDVVTVYPR